MVNFFTETADVNSFYRSRFLRSMKQIRPPLFIDATGPASYGGNGGIFRDRQKGGFEQIPEIRSFIESNYAPVAHMYSECFYLRRDLLGTRGE